MGFEADKEADKAWALRAGLDQARALALDPAASASDVETPADMTPSTPESPAEEPAPEAPEVSDDESEADGLEPRGDFLDGRQASIYRS